MGSDMILNDRSKRNLQGVHPQLVKVVEKAAENLNGSLGFIVTCGVRSVAEQRKLVQTGASQTMDSKHLTGHAVDLAATIDGDVRWDYPLYTKLAVVMKDAAAALNVQITWGGDWKSFKDGPHFELDPKKYPMPK